MQMLIIVNGKQLETKTGTSLAALQAELGIHSATCVAEVNGNILTAEARAEYVLQPGDRIELVTIVGGG